MVLLQQTTKAMRALARFIVLEILKVFRHHLPGRGDTSRSCAVLDLREQLNRVRLTRDNPKGRS